jgi:DNA helicase HerA-like ATPase
LYIPANLKGGMEEKGLQSFERIAKEGRKYGISLVVISQRPSDVNKTILSQKRSIFQLIQLLKGVYLMELLKNQLFLTLYHCQNQEDYLQVKQTNRILEAHHLN